MSPRVAMITFNPNPYDDRLYYKEARTLQEAGFQVHLIGPFPETAPRGNIHFLSIKKERNLFAMVRTTMEMVRNLNPEIIQFYDPIFIPGIKKLQGESRVKIIYNVSESYPDMMKEFSRKPFFIGYLLSYLVRLREERNAHLWDGIITTDHALFERFRKLNQQTVLVHLFPQLALFHGLKLPLPPVHRLKLVYIGQLRSERGIFSLIKAVKLFSEKNDLPIICDFYGEFSYLSEENLFHFELRHFNLEDRIKYHGSVDHEKVPEILSHYHIGVVTLLPIRKFMKNEPTKLFEYMAAGLPVLGSNLPPISRYVNRFECGQLCDPLQPLDIARTIEKLSTRKEDYLRFSRNGREAVEKELNWESQKAIFLSVFQ